LLVERLRLNPRNVEEAAQMVLSSLGRGAVIAPVLDGFCVLSHDPGWLKQRFGRAFRLVCDTSVVAKSLPREWRTAKGVLRPTQFLERVAQVLLRPVAAVLEGVEPWQGIARAGDGLSRLASARTEKPVGIGVPDEPTGIEELAAQLGGEVVLAVTVDGSLGPGPMIVDFRARPAVVDRRGRLGILELERELGEMVRLGPDLAFSVLVVCTGNSCRSPMAAGILSKMLGGERVFIYSAGTDAPVGSPATTFAVTTAAELGVDLNLPRSQQLDAGLVQSADLVLVMEEYHRKRVLELVPEAEPKTRLLGERDIADPIGRSLEFYRETAAELRRCLEPVPLEIRRRL
jgi:protein-tyrosine-phosphatase